jgi:hypothetical protein
MLFAGLQSVSDLTSAIEPDLRDAINQVAAQFADSSTPHPAGTLTYNGNPISVSDSGAILAMAQFAPGDSEVVDELTAHGANLGLTFVDVGAAEIWVDSSSADELVGISGLISVRFISTGTTGPVNPPLEGADESANTVLPLAGTLTPTSVALPVGPDYVGSYQCGDLLCRNEPELRAVAMLPDGTLRLVVNNARVNPSPLSVLDVNSQGEVIRRLSLPDSMHIRLSSGGSVSISPNGQWVAAGDTYGSELFQIDSTEAPQIIPRPDDIPIGAQMAARVADNGKVIISALGKSYIWDATNGLKRLDSLFASDPNADSVLKQADVYAISVNANTITGTIGNVVSYGGNVEVGTSGITADFGHATVWYDAGPLSLPDLGHPSVAMALSADGQIIGGSIRDIGAAIWIDRRLKTLVDEQGNPLSGVVSSIVTGFGGYKSAWAALGETATGQPFVAFDDGVAHPLGEWLDEHYDIQLSDESLAGAFYHDGALSLVTDHYSTCSMDVPFDPNICSATPSTQLAAHLTVVPVADGVGNEEPGRPAAFSVHLPNDSVWVYPVGTLKPIAGGFEALAGGGNEAVVNRYDSAGQITGTIHLAAPPGRTVAVSQFSDDGLWVKGQASTTTDWIDVYWNIEHPDQPLTAEQLDAMNRPSFSTGGASADGRVKVRGSESSTYGTVAIEVDGIAHEIHDANGSPITGGVDYLFAGIGGVATRWIALGSYMVNGYNGPYGDYFIAFSDGTMMKLWDFLHDQWPTTDFIDSHYINVAIGVDSILFVDSTFSGPPCNGTVCGTALFSTGFQVTSIPLPDKSVKSPLDLDNDSHVVATDAMAIINYLTDHGSGSSVTVLGTHSKYDIDDDGFVSPQDVLIIINSVNSSVPIAAPQTIPDLNGGEGEAPTEASTDALFAAAADTYFESLAPRRRLTGS